MSMETHVFFHGPLPRKSALRRAMRELGFPFTLTPDTGPLEGQSGFMPMRLRGEDTGVEFDVFEGRQAIDEFTIEGIDPAFDRCANFRWGGDETEMLAGLCAAASLAQLVGGVVFDEAEDRLLTVDEAVAVARKNLVSVLKPDAPKHPGTRPADIRRYLKPLLRLRPDLVLCGRRLLVRPVRHIMRGAFLDRTSDKYAFNIVRHINPMCGGQNSLGFGGAPYELIWKVWQPYFLPLLFDTLAEDVFNLVGKVTNLSGYADLLIEKKHYTSLLIRALVLAGERDRAVALIDDFERERAGSEQTYASWIAQQRELFTRDIRTICADAHRDEEIMAKALKLGDAWEPSPFPAELPPGARRSVDEPTFIPTPWLPKTPNLIVDPPQQTGAILFADQWLRPDDRIVFLAPLTREEAQRRHDAREDYCLAVRLAGGELLVLHHVSIWHPRDPGWKANPGHAPAKTYYLWVHGTANRLFARFSESWREPRQLFMGSVDIRTLEWTTAWHCFNDVEEKEITIYDPPSQRGERERIKRSMTESEVELCTRLLPAFGEFEDLLERANVYLSLAGYGRFTSQLT
ncbi:hypothetical protein RA307_04220 [Xanthobacteraceae bacterium Astr-EGSB]|uniref:hypothetical protein n=1 Tax=Astrobacterium formosum TaxID=3069710 RepID=UPI0027B66316|nr:hypothetical protein [Xanthobacteraceae bacterium Astr-EGSB]